MLKLRDYQLKSHELIIENFKLNKKVVLVVMAGGGKSITAGSFVAKYIKHFKFVLMVRKRDLVEQLAKDALGTFDLDYSIFMANHPKMDLSKSIQVCSKDTMQSRDTLPFEGEDDIIFIVDECDENTDYQREIIKRYSVSKRFFYFGMTATPFNGLDFFDVAIEPIKPKELLKRGILVEYIYHVPPIFNTEELEVIQGEFVTSQINKSLNSPRMIKDSFEWWLKVGENRQTMVFCINQDHGKNVEEYINNYYGMKVAICHDANTPKEERIAGIDAFKRGIYRFLINIGLYVRGTNIIEIGCILDLAPTLKLNRHIQKVTRGSRANPAYNDCLLIDIANNCINNGPVYTERVIDLSSNYKKKKSDLENVMMRVCEKCFRADETAAFGVKNICPFCGHCNKPIKKKKLSKDAENKIFLESASEEAIEQKRMINEFKKALWKKKNIGKRYRNDIALIYTQQDFMKKYGLEKILKIKKAIWLKDSTVEDYKRKQYVPLGGLDV